MTRRSRVAGDERGASIVEFALVAPLFIAFIIGIAQLGLLFFANAGLKHAVGEGARLATVFPRPADARIKTTMTDTRFGLEPARITAPTIIHGQVDGRDYVDIQMGYQVPIDFLFFQTPPVTLTEKRRVFVHPV